MLSAEVHCRLLLAASGMDVESYLSLLDEEKDSGFDDRYPPHQSMYTQSSKNGRPSTDSNNSNTVQSKSNNSNAESQTINVKKRGDTRF